MAGQIPSFLSASRVEIMIGGMRVAFAQNLSLSDNMATAPVGGIGAFNNHALEPLQYSAQGSLTITGYSDVVVNSLKSGGSNSTLPNPLADATPGNPTGGAGVGGDGNSLLIGQFFNPALMMATASVDLLLLERITTPAGVITADNSQIIMTLKDCRFNNWSMNVASSAMVNESVSFICRAVIDHTSEIEKA